MSRVLIIDDEPHVRAVLRLMLQGDGHEVRTAHSAAMALHCVSSEDIDVILCDLFMPGKNGVETIRELRRDFPGIPVIAMSSGGQRGQTDLLRVARSLGTAAVLLKPFCMAEVSSAMRAALSSPTATEG
jgi:CheY-like chemotaxis protein